MCAAKSLRPEVYDASGDIAHEMPAGLAALAVVWVEHEMINEQLQLLSRKPD
jgi:hypothetical protein